MEEQHDRCYAEASCFNFRSSSIFLADIKKSEAEAILITNMIDMAHRKDSFPSVAESESLITPTTRGPSPRPIRFSTRNKMAEASARIDAGTRL